MIYIRIEMWPGGDKDRARLLGEGTIVNQGGTAKDGTSDYELLLMKSPEYARPDNVGKPWKRSIVLAFPRLKLGPWDLLLRLLLVALAKRNRGAIQAAITGRSL